LARLRCDFLGASENVPFARTCKGAVSRFATLRCLPAPPLLGKFREASIPRFDLIDSSGLRLHKTLDISAAIWSTCGRKHAEFESMTPPRPFCNSRAEWSRQLFRRGYAMPNIASLLKEEISRLSRREIRMQVEATKRATTQHRRHIAALKRQVAKLQ